MTKNHYTTSNYADHSTFGGNVYNYDFEGYNSISDIAARIISDKKFDEKCKKNTLYRDRSKKIQERS